ncbi:MAG: PDZ domain-containing protein [Sphingobacteriaceae bacterium]|nr:PDZ domain-containing protein [Sphingobacteriaceae bacterium]MBK7816336.1 PDZ domain-containing protein [Sphingobacteriaceae bacterium]
MKTLFTTLIILSSISLNSQTLKRVSNKGNIGSPIPNELVEKNELKSNEGVYFRKVFPGTTAAELGVIEGDILLKVNGVEVKTIAELKTPSLKLREGETVTYLVMRDKEPKELKGKVIGNPKEVSEKLIVEYNSFKFKEGLIRSIYLKPKTTGKKPAILFIPGYPCTTIDNLPEHHPYKKLVYGLAEKGYIVMRAEKPGVGDCQNTPECNSMDFLTEVSSFKAALSDLKKQKDVDTNNVFILGHSMGGMEAPYVALNSNVKGIIVMGITIKPWLEYLTEMLRVQNPQLGIDYVQSEKDMKLYETLLFQLLVNNKKTSELVSQNNEYARILKRDFNYAGGDDFLTRDIIFSQSLNKINVTETWANTTSKVLSAWGETDIQTINDFSHKELVKIVNKYHPNNAAFLELKGTDHNLMLIPTMEESYQRNANGTISSIFPTNFNTKIIEDFDVWMKKIISNN